MAVKNDLVRKVLSGGAFVGSKVASKIALPAAICSTTHDGSYLSRGVGGIKTTFDVIGGIAEAYFNNSGVRDVVNGASLEVMKAIGDAARNIQEDPERVLYAALGTFVLLKACDGMRYATSQYKLAKERRELRRYKEQQSKSKRNY